MSQQTEKAFEDCIRGHVVAYTPLLPQRTDDLVRKIVDETRGLMIYRDEMAYATLAGAFDVLAKIDLFFSRFPNGLTRESWYTSLRPSLDPLSRLEPSTASGPASQ